MDSIIAHKREDGAVQTLAEHLDATAELAGGFALPRYSSTAYNGGKKHDIGKFREGFQRRINGSNERCEHACCGAEAILRCNGKTPEAYMLAYAVAGHHSGLPDGGTSVDSPTDATLSASIKRGKAVADLLPEAKEWEKSFAPNDDLFRDITEIKDQTEVIERFAFFTRYIFSCLTDADFIDTERFCQQESRSGIKADLNEALRLVKEKMSGFSADTEVRRARNRLQQQAFSNSDFNGIAVMNMPTGSGKTLCSIRLALERAVKLGRRRIIYVIPYTSIIEQTADVFRGIFGDVLPVLEHHSNYSPDDTEDDSMLTPQKIKQCCENWDAPLIVTTNVQFFQSLYHHKGSRLRKLHNLAESVIVFDEVHMMPIEFLQPCLRGIGYVTRFLESDAVFLSATMPDFSELLNKYASGSQASELIPDRSDAGVFRRCSYEYLGRRSMDEICGKACEHESSLVIVNSRKAARELYSMMKDSDRRVFHLSTYMTPYDRSEVIGEIRKCLAEHIPVTVISTSLIEAGVDLDFEAVFRELAGLDSILQSAGRCNREGIRERGYMYVYESEKGLPRGDLGVRAEICRSMFGEYEDITSDECIREYYSRLFRLSEDKIKHRSIAESCARIDMIPFRTFSENFKFIDSDTIGVIIPCEESIGLIEALRQGNRGVLGKLRRYTASVMDREFRELLSGGLLEECGGAYVLADERYYTKETGLDSSFMPDNIF